MFLRSASRSIYWLAGYSSADRTTRTHNTTSKRDRKRESLWRMVRITPMASFSVRPSLSAFRFAGFSRSGLSLSSFNTTRRIALLQLGSGMNFSASRSRSMFFRCRSLICWLALCFINFPFRLTSPRCFFAIFLCGYPRLLCTSVHLYSMSIQFE